MQVVNVHAILDRVHAQLVGRPVGRATTDSATGEQH